MVHGGGGRHLATLEEGTGENDDGRAATNTGDGGAPHLHLIPHDVVICMAKLGLFLVAGTLNYVREYVRLISNFKKTGQTKIGRAHV